MGIRDIAKKIAESDARGGGNWLKDGRGVLVVKALKFDNMEGGDTFVAEMLVESSESYPDAKDDKGQPVIANAPGSTVSYVQQLDKFKSAFSNTKTFILALMGEDESAVKPEDFAAAFEKLCSKENPARGMRIKYSTFRKLTKAKDKSLTLPVWEHVTQTADDIAATRAKLEGTA